MTMLNKKPFNRFIHLLAIAMLLTSFNAYAEQGAIKFTNKAYKQVMTKAKDGSVTYDYVKPGLVLPKDVILYEIVFENISDKPVDNIVINNPIANNSVYREGSATGDSTDITFSVDGKNFSAANALKVTDANGKTRLAKPEEYTAIRWKYTKQLKPGAKEKLTYKTMIK
jgi:uncharacterized repeat protein (TIGR01451 family)